MTNNYEMAMKLKAAATACEQQEPLSLVVYHGKMCLRNTGGIVFSVLRDSAFPEYSAENENYARLAEAANPVNILAMLAERDADKKLIADLQRHREEETQRANRADFEGYSRAMREMEARTVSVKLPPVSFFDFKAGSGFADGAYVNLEAMNKALRAAGINLEVGE